ncbi:MAG: hypothetical protein V4588_00320 [Pseudomonadota bacterium]
MTNDFVLNTDHIPSLNSGLTSINAILDSMNGATLQAIAQKMNVSSSDVILAKAQGMNILTDHGVKIPKILPAKMLNWNEYLIKHAETIQPVAAQIQSALLKEDEASIRAKYYKVNIEVLDAILDGNSFTEAAERFGIPLDGLREMVMSLTFQISNRVERSGVDRRLLQRGSIDQMRENKEYWRKAIDIFLQP